MTQADVEKAFSEVPLPPFADASDVQFDGPDSYRVLLGQDREVGPITVGTTAVQYLDGRIDDGGDGDAPKIWIGDTGFNTEGARQLAAALIAAADELDAVAGQMSAAACGYSWCANTTDGHKEHTWSDSVDCSSLAGKLRRVAVWTSIEDGYAEPIMVSIEGGPDEIDEGQEAWLTIEQAERLRAILDKAIGNARTAPTVADDR